MDHGREFVLCIFVQELLRRDRFSQRRLPWRQTSTSNYVAQRMWSEVNKQVNYHKMSTLRNTRTGRC